MAHAPDPHALALSDAEAYDDLRAHEWETAERDTDFFDAPMLSVAEAAMVPDALGSGGGPNASHGLSQPQAPSSGAPKAEPPSARPHSDDDPAGRSHERRPVGESQCPVCHGAMVVPVGPRDWSGQQAVTDCPRCARSDHVEAPAPRDRPCA